MQSQTERKRFLNSLNQQELTVFLQLLWDNARALGGMTKRRGKQMEADFRKGDINRLFQKALPRTMLYLYWVNNAL